LALAVLLHAADQIGGDANIDGAAITVCHDVDPAAFFHGGRVARLAAEEKRDPGSSPG
jgi:hypothetical protein